MLAVTSATLDRYRIVHTWSSVACTAFVLVLCVTGLPLVFRDEIEAFIAPRPHARRLPAATERYSLDRLVEIGKQRYPHAFVQFLFWDRDEPHVVGLGMGDARGAGLSGVTRVLLDDRTGETIGSARAEDGVLDLIADVHRNLCTGTTGDVLLGGVALAFLVSLVSGVFVYAPLLRRVGFGVVRRARSRRTYWLDVHNLVSMLCLLWALVVGATGFVNTLEAPLFEAWDRATMPALLARDRDRLPPTRRSSVDAAVAVATSALSGMQPTSVGFPQSPFGSPRHYLIWMCGGTFLTSRFFTPVLVDAESGALVLARPLPWYLRVLELARPLHFGDYGGLPLKLAWAAFDTGLLAILGSGLYLWLRRLRSRE